MRTRLRERLADRTDEGFTLIELMVVVLIIAILLAIAIPSFLGARGKAQDRAAQSNVRNALTAEKTYYTDQQKYSDTTTDISAIEPSLDYKNAAPAEGGKEVQLMKGDATTGGTTITNAVICIESIAANGHIWMVKDVAAGPNAGTYFGTAQIPASCNDSKLTNSDGTVSTKW